ncbi:CidA/LrgA family protein [Paenibacillus sp. SI8]|uniref:CidA/LrgA family protein n=1 Tax=unclassified Paenibacillus TaxID=185978 RepID=UPI00346597F7
MRSLFQTMIQIALFIGIAKFSDALVRWLHIPVPGSIVGIVLLFGLLKTKIIRLHWVEKGSSWLLGEMLLFFIPAAVGIMNYKSLVIHSGLSITITIVGSTIVVMLCAGLMGEWAAKHHRKRREVA